MVATLRRYRGRVPEQVKCAGGGGGGGGGGGAGALARTECSSPSRPSVTLVSTSPRHLQSFSVTFSQLGFLVSWQQRMLASIRKYLESAGHFAAAPRSAFKIRGQACRAWSQRSMGKRAIPWICSSAVTSWPRRAGRTILRRGRGVVVPHPLRRRKDLGSNPNVCIHQGCSGN